jgi:ABC-type amino acid transport substrate-binding protein
MKSAEGRWVGFSVELWQAVAPPLDRPFAFREFDTFDGLLAAMERREIDVIPSLPVRERFEAVMDFSQSYLQSGLAIAVPAEGVTYRWVRVLGTIFSLPTLKAVGLLLLLSLLAGAAVWLCERRANRPMFGEGRAGGVGQGLWWAVVTMTTVGYGDTAPRTAAGRAVALAWMLFSIIFIAALTAEITASLTVSELRGKVRGLADLPHARVGSVTRSEGLDFLGKTGVGAVPFALAEEGLAALADGRLDAFVLNAPVLRHLVRRDYPGRLMVLPGTFDEYFVGIGLQDGSPLRKPLNKALLKFMKTTAWTELQHRYLQ